MSPCSDLLSPILLDKCQCLPLLTVDIDSGRLPVFLWNYSTYRNNFCYQTHSPNSFWFSIYFPTKFKSSISFLNPILLRIDLLSKNEIEFERTLQAGKIHKFRINGGIFLFSIYLKFWKFKRKNLKSIFKINNFPSHILHFQIKSYFSLRAARISIFDFCYFFLKICRRKLRLKALLSLSLLLTHLK